MEPLCEIVTSQSGSLSLKYFIGPAGQFIIEKSVMRLYVIVCDHILQWFIIV